jgi:two-component system NtrC family sensor kinase
MDMPEKQYRVLIIDDEEMVIRSFARILREHHVTALLSAADALSRAAAGETWDVILCDLQMPHMDGAQFCKFLERIRPDLARRLVFITGGAFTDRVQSFIQRTARPIVLKPVEPDALRALVSRVAAGSTSSK